MGESLVRHVARSISVRGIVQGVGFRPFVRRLASTHALKGHVTNTLAGVSIHVEGTESALRAFIDDLRKQAPPLAQIDHIDETVAAFSNPPDFKIAPSVAHGRRATLISPDVATCPDCMDDVHTPSNRRYRYPFTNCTNCGPRYTIIEDVPYDRVQTTMRGFTMCAACSKEYHDVTDRRFHAQPNACADCGPQLTLYDHTGHRVWTSTPLESVSRILKDGKIVGVKGLGGFHLVADAANDQTVRRLRENKYRPAKPFAVMSRQLDDILRYAHLSRIEKQLLLSRSRPIVLLRKRMPFPLSAQIAPGNRYIGVMLPYTPLHDLLFNDQLRTLVMTSGNPCGEPIVIENEEAFAKLLPMVDFILLHDRGIITRNDDSVAMIAGGQARLIRRSRGYVPVPIDLKKKIPAVLACGAEQKNTICLTKNHLAFLSQHLGDISTLESYSHFKRTITHLRRILDIAPKVVAYDLHPDYLTAAYAHELTDDAIKVGVQHHHAHVVSCMAENHLEGPVIGLAFDGTGYGADGHIWGGEIMVTRQDDFERLGHLEYVPMPGGHAAVKEPWRMAVSLLWHTYGKRLFDLELPFLQTVTISKIERIVEMITKKINTPLTSSMGRLFDGIAALIGLSPQTTFEGQAAMELESLCTPEVHGHYAYAWDSQETYTLSLKPIIEGVVLDMAGGLGQAVISTKFHNTIIHLVGDLCRTLRQTDQLNQVALSGGVFQNRTLLNGLVRHLETCGFQTFAHALVPTNDGGISLGQAVIAAARVEEGKQ